MPVEIRRQPMRVARAVKHVAAQPHAVIGGLHHGQIAVMPLALIIGADIGPGRHGVPFLRVRLQPRRDTRRGPEGSAARRRLGQKRVEIERVVHHGKAAVGIADRHSAKSLPEISATQLCGTMSPFPVLWLAYNFGSALVPND